MKSIIKKLSFLILILTISGCVSTGTFNSQNEQTSVPGTSNLSKIKVGMGIKQTTDILGNPTDTVAENTWQLYIPVYGFITPYAVKKTLYYQGKGEIVLYATADAENFTVGKIIYNPNSSGYRH